MQPATYRTVIGKKIKRPFPPPLHLPFGAIGPLGLHEAGCTLEFQLHPYWLALELLVGGGPGDKNISQLQCGMWLVALPDLGDHAFPFPIMIGWLTHLFEFCDGFRGWFCSRRSPHIWLFSWRGICCEYLQVWKSCLDISVSPNLVCLNYLEMIVDFTEFGVLDFFLDHQNSPFLWIGLARICLACYFWF